MFGHDAHYREVGRTQKLSGCSESKDKFVSVHGMKVYGQSRRIVPLVLKLSISLVSE
jgi:hypothetical protein